MVPAILGARRAADEKIRRGEPSEFSAVWSRYLRPGESVLLTARGGRFSAEIPSRPFGSPLPPEGAGVRIRHDRGGPFAFPVSGVSPAHLGEEPLTREMRLRWGSRLRLGIFSAIISEQSGTARVVVYDPREPRRRNFRGLKHFPVDLSYRIPVLLERLPTPRMVRLISSRGLEKEYLEYGVVYFPLHGPRHRLYVYVPANQSAHPTEFFIPFRDATSGKESYKLARYVSLTRERGANRFILDFNQAENPSCAYSEHFNCPLPPKANTLSVPVRAGEMDYKKFARY